MKNDDFFENSKECSRIKSQIVSQYFWAWAWVISNANRNNEPIAYIDLYSGPGIYEDGTESTPILILKNAINTPAYHGKLMTYFNDVEKEHVDILDAAIKGLPDISKLKYVPQVSNETVGDRIVKQLQSVALVPTLLFIDPWGYKGLTLDLIGAVLKDWGCDCIFFFNYRRINMAINNPTFAEHVDAIFGKTKADELRLVPVDLSPDEREAIILTALKEALKKIRGEFVREFKFFDDNGTRTSHFIIMVSKNHKAYEIMKNIMAPLSSKIVDEISFFEFNPNPPKPPAQLNLFAVAARSPMEDLKDELLAKFAGQTLPMQNVYLQHHVNTNYTEKNYKKVLLTLEQEGKITANPPMASRPSRNGQKTFGPNVNVTFP